MRSQTLSLLFATDPKETPVLKTVQKEESAKARLPNSEPRLALPKHATRHRWFWRQIEVLRIEQWLNRQLKDLWRDNRRSTPRVGRSMSRGRGREMLIFVTGKVLVDKGP